MRYGICYKGSKNSIAKWLVDELPKADIFCDLFFGGGAITHASLLSGKYKSFIVNDIDARLPKLFLDSIHGKYTVKNHTDWIDRQTFNDKKVEDAYIALVWSFGNNGIDYIYGKELEEYKKGLHYACFENNIDLLNDLGIKLTRSNSETVNERLRDYTSQIKNTRFNVLETFTRLQSLENLQSFGEDYRDIKIPKGSLIYCDIPYLQTNCGKYQGFNHEQFYEWARKQDNIFISEYSMPDDFIPYAWVEKQVLSSANTNALKTKEMIFTNKRTFDKLGDSYKKMAKLNFCEQLSLF